MNYLSSIFNLEGKTVVITGSAGFLCSKMADGFHRAGCSLAILDADMEGADLIATQINQGNGKALPLEMNVCSKQDFECCMKKILNEFGRVDVLINGAGINAPTPFLEITEEEWDQILEVQLKGTMFGCQMFGR